VSPRLLMRRDRESHIALINDEQARLRVVELRWASSDFVCVFLVHRVVTDSHRT
jgi:hypothetical protein